MPSFDITSEFNQQEVINAIDQMNREIINRYDFKDTNTSVSFSNSTISLRSATEERLNAADQVLREKFAKRNVSIKFLSNFNDEQTPSEAKREYTLKSGLDKEISKIIVKDLKEFSKKINQTVGDDKIIDNLNYVEIDKKLLEYLNNYYPSKETSNTYDLIHQSAGKKIQSHLFLPDVDWEKMAKIIQSYRGSDRYTVYLQSIFGLWGLPQRLFSRSNGVSRFFGH